MATREEKILALHAEAEEYERIQQCTCARARQAIADWHRVADWETLLRLPTDDPQRPAPFPTTAPQLEKQMSNDYDQRDEIYRVKAERPTGDAFPKIDVPAAIETMGILNGARPVPGYNPDPGVVKGGKLIVDASHGTQMRLAEDTIKVKMSPAMQSAMAELCTELDMSPEAIFKQAFRLYQTVHARQASGQRVQFTSNGDVVETLFGIF